MTREWPENEALASALVAAFSAENGGFSVLMVDGQPDCEPVRRKLYDWLSERGYPVPNGWRLTVTARDGELLVRLHPPPLSVGFRLSPPDEELANEIVALRGALNDRDLAVEHARRDQKLAEESEARLRTELETAIAERNRARDDADAYRVDRDYWRTRAETSQRERDELREKFGDLLAAARMVLREPRYYELALESLRQTVWDIENPPAKRAEPGPVVVEESKS